MPRRPDLTHCPQGLLRGSGAQTNVKRNGILYWRLGLNLVLMKRDRISAVNTFVANKYVAKLHAAPLSVDGDTDE